MLISTRDGGLCDICRVPFKVGEEMRLFLSIYGITEAHETCFVNAKTRIVCSKCGRELQKDEKCHPLPDGTPVVEIIRENH